MKTKIVLFLSCLCSVLLAQPIPVTIVETRPEVLCAGDSVEARFAIIQSVPPNQNFEVRIKLDKGSMTFIDTIFAGTLQNLVVVDTMQIGLIYGVKFKVPAQCPSGNWFVSGNINAPGQFSFIINQCHKNPIHILTASKDTVCPGVDSICVTIVNPFLDPFYLSFESQGFPPVLTWIPVYPSSGDNDTSTYCFLVPGWISLGNGFLGIDLESDPNFPIVYWCPGMGIHEWQLNTLTPKYFTLDNFPTPPIPNTILRQEWTLPDGRKYNRKILIQSE